MSLDELKVGYFYSNGAYGRTWGVRQLLEILTDESSGEPRARFRGVAGVCRRKKGLCSPAEFAQWAKHRVELLENDWKRAPDDPATS